MIAGMIAGIAGTIGGIIAGIVGMTGGIVEMTGGITGKSRKAFAMGLGGGRKTRAIAAVSIPTTPAITGRETVTTAKVSVAGTLRAFANTPTIGDGNRSDA
jgi:hypothetical protein